MSHKKTTILSVCKALAYFLSAALLLTYYSLLLYGRPFGGKCKLLGIPYENKIMPSLAQIKTIDLIKTAVRRAAKVLPWRCTCLIQALAARKLLKKNHILSCLYLGVDKDIQDKLLAHAWVKCGDFFVTGKIGHEDYTVTAIYS